MTARVRRASQRITIRAKLIAITALLVGVIAAIMWLSAASTSADHQRALVDNVAGRQPLLAERYVAEVQLTKSGVRADPEGTAAQLLHDTDALLDGGAVLAVQGNDAEFHLDAQTDPAVRAKLTELGRMAQELTAAGDAVIAADPAQPGYAAALQHLQVTGQATANVGHDAVGRMTSEADAAVNANARAQLFLAAAGILLALALSWLLGRKLVQRLRGLVDMARATAGGDLASRFSVTQHDEVGALGTAFNEMADSLGSVVAQLEADADRESFSSHLMEAFEMVDEEDETFAVAELAMREIDPERPMELLLADSSHAHLKQVAVSPSAGAPGCSVASPFSCVAVRRGRAVTFDSSEALNACPKLRDRGGDPCSAVCVPVSFMGKSLGVLHTTGAEHRPPTADQTAQLVTLASHASSRIGTVRAFQQSQLQATTDGLTGLINRRTLENELRTLLQDGKQFALAFADLDHFKQLNDTFGHEGGDRALRLFSRTMREAVRTGDTVARYGGEEFVFVFPGLDAPQGAALLERLRVILSGAVVSSDAPAFTASFGITANAPADTVDDLLRRADESLMAAKRAGRDRVVIADPAANGFVAAAD